jgi:hypothetical protein
MTFACYGMHLHGEKSGSVDRNRKVPDKDRRTAVSEAIREVCIQRNRSPRAACVRGNHVHVALEGIDDPERTLWARHGSTR